jgi:hypothetical protein
MAKKITSLSDYRKMTHARADRVGRSINPMREQYIRDQARNLLIAAWRAERVLRKIELADILPVEPRWIVERLFGDWSFEEPSEIGTFSGRKVVGVLNRATKKIEVAANFPHLIRRFTGAHEIGHLVLPPEQQLLRESPLTAGGLENRHTSPTEQEANIFAAETLMPPRLSENSSSVYSGRLLTEQLSMTTPRFIGLVANLELQSFRRCRHSNWR